MCRILSHTVQIRLYFNMTHIWYRMKDNENTAMTEKLEKGCYVLSLSGRDQEEYMLYCAAGKTSMPILPTADAELSQNRRKKSADIRGGSDYRLIGALLQIRL